MPIRVKTPDGVHVFPDGTTPEEIEEALNATSDDAPSMAVSHESAPTSQDTPSRDWGDTAADWLPTVGAGVAAAALAPAAAAAAAPLAAAGILAAGAGLGGGAGQAGRRLIEGLRGRRDWSQDTTASRLADVGGEGAKQAAMQLIGGVAGKGLQKGGHALYRGLLKPSVKLRQGFGGKELVETLIDDAAMITPRGLAQTTGRLGASRDSAMEMVRAANQLGAPNVAPAEIIREFQPVIETLKKRAMTGQVSELPAVGARGRRLVQAMQKGRGIDVEAAQALKETAQDSASGAYRAVERGAAKQLGADDMLDSAVAKGFKSAVERHVPGIKAQNRRTQALLGGKIALEEALESGANRNAIGGMRDLIALGAGGAGFGLGGPEGAAAAAMLSRLLGTQRGGSSAAILMDRAGKLTPAGLRLMRGMMTSHGEDE